MLQTVTGLESGGRDGCERESDLEARAAAGRRSDHDSAVVGHDDCEHECEAETGAAAFRREERTEHPFANRRIDAAAVVVECDPPDALALVHVRSDADARRLL